MPAAGANRSARGAEHSGSRLWQPELRRCGESAVDGARARACARATLGVWYPRGCLGPQGPSVAVGAGKCGAGWEVLGLGAPARSLVASELPGARLARVLARGSPQEPSRAAESAWCWVGWSRVPCEVGAHFSLSGLATPGLEEG